SYIIYMGEHSEGLQLTKALLHNRTDFHIDFLGSILGWHINGFAAELDEKEVAEIQKNPKVVSVFPNEERELHTSHSWNFLSLERTGGVIPSDSLWRKTKFGEDIIIGNIDSGIWPESPSFNDEGFGPIPSRWKGRCEDDNGSTFPCNRKLIGAKYFYEGYVKATGHTNVTIKSPRDYHGHGTHTLSTAGGNFVPGANVLEKHININGTTKGGSPKARVAAYKACWSHSNSQESCLDADILKAFDHAIDDGVDVISVSLGGKIRDYYDSGIAIGAFYAMKHGIPVIASAGNNGPASGTVENVAPWLITVAASTTDRDIYAYVQLDNGMRLKGKSLSEPLPEERFYPLVSGADAKLANASSWEALLCRLKALDPEKVKGNILVCLMGEIPSTVKGKHALLAGAAGMILCNDEFDGNDLTAEAHFLPAAQISYIDGLSVFAYINSTKNPLGIITPPNVEYNIRGAPRMASFSSRGPNVVTPEILKPDITAPGVEIMAAYTDERGPTEVASDQRRSKYTFMSGTSMACPHVAGVVGLLKLLHPNWSPAAIRSAMMTTASTIDDTQRTILDHSLVEATPLNYGAGHIRPDLAADPGLVYDLNSRDYDNFLCAINYNETLRKKFTESHTCSFLNTPSLLDFNYPSINVPKLIGSVIVNRILKNVGPPGVYQAQIQQPLGV
ncbi:hypothetical protein RD792_005777, partial [Penstemon davidsonii]